MNPSPPPNVQWKRIPVIVLMSVSLLLLLLLFSQRGYAAELAAVNSQPTLQVDRAAITDHLNVNQSQDKTSPAAPLALLSNITTTAVVSGGLNLDFALDSSGNPVFVYTDSSETLRIFSCDDPLCATTTYSQTINGTTNALCVNIG